MDVEFADASLDRLEVDREYTAGFEPETVRGYRKALQAVRAAVGEDDLYAMRCLGFQKIHGDLFDKNTMRLSRSHVLAVEFINVAKKVKIRVLNIEANH